MTHLTAEGAAFTELLLEVFRLHGLLLEAGARLTSPLGLTSARWQVLGVVEHGPVTVSEIGRVMGLARQSVQQQTDALEREGFLTYMDNPRHRRARLVQLTEKGREVAASLIPAQAQWANHIGQVSPPEALRAALETLRVLSERLEQDTLPAT
ncbi:transcriptional activatory protein BadR [Deinococcus carri]|uniref:Transcriptional activatory protein BadR n=1 Tax=Deinococcus carri TaxID=1211323 RepID=A0ABP9W758_9DEIO